LNLGQKLPDSQLCITTEFIFAGKISKMSMEELMNFFQGSLEKDFGYSDDHVIESMRNCGDELRRAHLDLPLPPADESELPTKPFGVFVPPTIDQIIGRQSTLVDGEIVEMVVIPADGGPVMVPVRAVDHPSSIASSSVLDHYDTATDGLSSRRISVRDGQSSVTSLVDEFLDIEDDIGNTTAEGEDLQVDSVEVNDEIVESRQWPWDGSMQYITSAGPTSRMVPAPAMRSVPLMSPVSDGGGVTMGRNTLGSDVGGVTVGRNTVGMVSLNQPVSLVTVVAEDDKSATPTARDQRLPLQRFVTTARAGEPSDVGVRDFFAPTTEPWSHYVRSSPYPPVTPNTMYHLYALKSAKDLSRQQYFSSDRVNGKSDVSHRSQMNGLSMQAGRHRQPSAVSAPAIGVVWPENSDRLSSPGLPASANGTAEQPVLNVRSRVVSPSGSQVGSNVIFPGRDVQQRPSYLSSTSQPLLGNQANWVYRM